MKALREMLRAITCRFLHHVMTDENRTLLLGGRTRVAVHQHELQPNAPPVLAAVVGA
jgi:hypothetical protein